MAEMCGGGDDDGWKVDDALHTLMRAEEIKADAELMAKVQEKIGKKQKAIKSIAQLRKVAAKKTAEPEEKEEEE